MAYNQKAVRAVIDKARASGAQSVRPALMEYLDTIDHAAPRNSGVT